MDRANRVIAGSVANDIEFLVVADISRIAIERLQRDIRSAGAVGNLQTTPAALARDRIHPIRNISRVRLGNGIGMRLAIGPEHHQER